MSSAAPLAIVATTVGGVEVGIRCEDGRLAALGPDVVPRPGDEVLDGRGTAAVPGLVNGHTHAAMTLLRSFGDDMSLQPWLQDRIWPAEARLEPEDVYWGTRLAALEMIRSGTTHFVDMYWHAGAVARAAVDAGVRATVSQVLIDGGPEAPASATEALVATARESLDELEELPELITPSLGPHAVYTVSPAGLAAVAALAGDRDVLVHLHLAETEAEVHDCVEATGRRPVTLLREAGLLGARLVGAHGCWLDQGELEELAGAGATVVTNPVSNLKLTTGRTFPWPAADACGLAVALGTDGAASNNSLDLLADVKVLALVQKAAASDPAVLPAAEAWAVATGARAPALGGTPLAVGAPADLCLVDVTAPEMNPGPLEANLVYAATGAVVDTTVVAGRVLMHRRQVPGAEEVVARAGEAAARLRGGG